MRDRNDILDGLRRSGRILEAFVQTIPAEDLIRSRGAGCWTAAEHVSHLAQVQPMLLERIQRFLQENHPVFVPYIPAEDESEGRPAVIDTLAALEAFRLCRGEQAKLLAAADDSAWQKTGSHPEYTRYSLYILARHILMHDHWHMYRMEELWLTRDAYLTTLEG